MPGCALAEGRQLRFGIRLHVIVQESVEEAWQEADRLLQHLSDLTIEAAQQHMRPLEPEGQRLMRALRNGRREGLEISPNLWAGVGLVRQGAGTALMGDPATVAARMLAYADLSIDSFILSGHPHLEEAYRFAELLFPRLPIELSSRILAGHTSRPVAGYGENEASLRLPGGTAGSR